MLINFKTVRFRLISILLIVLLGILLLAMNSYISDQKLLQLNNRLINLQESRSHLDRLKALIEENNRLLVQVVFQKKTRLSARLLAKNEDILNEFEAFRNDAYIRHLDEDYNFAQENETLILSLRKDFYTIVAKARKGNYKAAQKQVFRLLDHRIKPIFGFMENAKILRNLRVEDARKELSKVRFELNRNTILIFTAIFLVTLTAILFVARSITRPLTTLLNTVQKISRHKDLSIRAKTGASGEIGHLAKSFNQMIGQLESSKKQSEEINQYLKLARNRLTQEAKKREQLIQQLETKNSELERFTYTVSHDLKSPLVTIKGFTGMLAEDIKDGESNRINKDLEHIATATDKMAELLDDLLELSRIGRLINKPESIPLTELFEEVLGLIYGQINLSAANINIQADMPAIFADRHRMREVAQNLLDNAIKFHRPDTAPDISVSAKTEQDHVICCISDNGIGINPDYHDKIFGLFDRLDLTFEGTGIGLALVKRIIEVHNGSVTVESEGEGKGTRFCFTLPESRSN